MKIYYDFGYQIKKITKKKKRLAGWDSNQHIYDRYIDDYVSEISRI